MEVEPPTIHRVGCLASLALNCYTNPCLISKRYYLFLVSKLKKGGNILRRISWKGIRLALQSKLDRLRGKSHVLKVKTKLGYQNLDIAGKAETAKDVSKQSWQNFYAGILTVFFKPVRHVTHFALVIMIIIVLSAGIPSPAPKATIRGEIAKVDPYGINALTKNPSDSAIQLTDLETVAMTASYISDDLANQAYEAINNQQTESGVTVSGDAIANLAVATTEKSGGNKASFASYTVQDGDTLWSIARDFGVTTDSIKWSNGITDENFVKPGQTINVPTVTGIIYTVKAGDSIEAIASRYKSTVALIESQNDLYGEGLKVGVQIIIPDGVIEAPAAPKVAVSQSTSRSGRYGSAAAIARTGTFQFPTIVGSSGYYNGYHSWAIDIPNSIGTPIYAADSGLIVEAKYGYNGGFGNTILINHGDGFQTRYGHMSTLVILGGYVSKGQLIGYMGSTGRSTGSHLHLEIIRNGIKLNPCIFFTACRY